MGHGKVEDVVVESPGSQYIHRLHSYQLQQSISIEDKEFKSACAFCRDRTPRPHLPPNTDVSAMGLFELFFDDEILTSLVNSTDAYAEIKEDQKRQCTNGSNTRC